MYKNKCRKNENTLLSFTLHLFYIIFSPSEHVSHVVYPAFSWTKMAAPSALLHIFWETVGINGNGKLKSYRLFDNESVNFNLIKGVSYRMLATISYCIRNHIAWWIVSGQNRFRTKLHEETCQMPRTFKWSFAWFNSSSYTLRKNDTCYNSKVMFSCFSFVLW